MSQEQSSIGENPRALTISGSISPAYSGENVSIYVSSGSSYDYFTTVTDDSWRVHVDLELHLSRHILH